MAYRTNRNVVAQGVGSRSGHEGLVEPDSAIPTLVLGRSWLPGPGRSRFNGRSIRYVLFVPPESDSGQPLPLIVSLNGFGENGTDGRHPLLAGIAPEVWERYQARKPFPAFVLFPQAGSGFDEKVLDDVLRRTCAHYAVDPRRLYLTGISSGASAAWLLAATRPKLWAALVPMAGVMVHRGIAIRLHGLPIWVFHNAYDNPKQVRQAIQQLRESSQADVRLTEYDQPGHDAWTRACADDALYEWLWRQRAPETLDR